ncbi:MAG TPA: arabinofuranosidase catalytic domain-containing protein [Fibrobacteria bacterium]|nr:arabinofuranosidase catalytic domain-containing protein [Fibrobacteria bacterium]
MSKPSEFGILLSIVLASGIGETGMAANGPCDIYQTAGNPCTAAHSTVRALYGAYSGKLYQVRRTDNTTKDIMTLSAGGAADAAAQDSFCTASTCVITKVYDQSGKGNDLQFQGSGSTPGGHDYPSTATKESLMLGGHKVYSLWIDGTETTSAAGSTTNQPNSYWVNGSGNGIPLGSSPEAIYMVTSGTHYNNGCCFDYGNSETSRTAVGAGHMDAIYFGSSCWFSSNANYKCSESGSGPWVQADIEYGLFASNSQTTWNASEVSETSKYVTAMEKNNGTTQLVLKGGNAQSGSLTPLYSGSLPAGWNPMHKEGAIVLGSGGDCCNTNQNMSAGTFYEGAIVGGSSIPTDATDNAIQANIVSAGYGSSATAISNRSTGKAPTFLRYDPVTRSASVGYTLETPGYVRLRVVDLQGREVSSFVDGMASTGSHVATWDAKNARSGLYYVVMSVDGSTRWTGSVLVSR